MASMLDELSAGKKLLLGVVHLQPLPGSPRYGERLESVVEAARADAAALLDAGFDGYVLENFGDAPFFKGPVPPYVLTCMARIACELPREGAFVAVNVLRNDAAGALSVAAAAGLQAIRVNVHCGASITDQGLIEGRAAETLRLRKEIAPSVAILADVDVKHAAPLHAPGRYGIQEAARDAAYRGLADALIVTGRATGEAVDPDDLKAIRKAVPDRPTLVGSGVTAGNVGHWLQEASGIIVGSWLKREGRAEKLVDPGRTRKFIEATRRA